MTMVWRGRGEREGGARQEGSGRLCLSGTVSDIKRGSGGKRQGVMCMEEDPRL